jgi:hypothetical protein
MSMSAVAVPTTMTMTAAMTVAATMAAAAAVTAVTGEGFRRQHQCANDSYEIAKQLGFQKGTEGLQVKLLEGRNVSQIHFQLLNARNSRRLACSSRRSSLISLTNAGSASEG